MATNLLQIFAPQKLWRSQVVERLGAPSPATDATSGFLQIPAVAGSPTGTPELVAGFAPMVVDITNNRLLFYSGGAWRAVGLP